MRSSAVVVVLGSALWLLAAAQGKELTVVCVGGGDCVLPCQFESDGKGARIMWFKKKSVVSCTRYGNTSFVVGHSTAAQKYLGRTGLYADQVLEGNATLMLRNVTPADQGKYVCVTMKELSTNESGVISLVVQAPVRDVDIEFNEGAVVCRANGIFPAPTVNWSTDPPAHPDNLTTETSSLKNRVGFYHVVSSLRLKGNNRTSNRTFICSVTAGEDNEKKTAFLKHEEAVSASAGSSVKIPCTLNPTDLQNFNLTWRFRFFDPIVTINVTNQRSQVKVWDPWKSHVLASLEATNSLHVHALTLEIVGTYTCEVSTPQETFITRTEVTTEDVKGITTTSLLVLLVSVLLVSYSLFTVTVNKQTNTRLLTGRKENKDGFKKELHLEHYLCFRNPLKKKQE